MRRKVGLEVQVVVSVAGLPVDSDVQTAILLSLRKVSRNESKLVIENCVSHVSTSQDAPHFINTREEIYAHMWLTKSSMYSFMKC